MNSQFTSPTNSPTTTPLTIDYAMVDDLYSVVIPPDPKFTLLVNELLEEEPRTVNIQSLPYSQEEKYEHKVQMTYWKLLRSAKSRRRILTLIYAFYLGQLIDGDSVTKSQNIKARQLVSEYYFKASKRVFRLFEEDPAQIYRTKTITLSTLTQISHDDYISLVPLNVLPGGSN